MLKIYTANTESAFDKEKVQNKEDVIEQFDYNCPENFRSSYEQLEWMESKKEEFLEKDITIKTYSPYILNLLNLWLAKKEFNYNNLEVYEVFFDEDDNTISVFDLRVQNEGVELIDTRCASEAISDIYNEYNNIKEK